MDDMYWTIKVRSTVGGSLMSWLKIAKSTLDEAGYGLFADRDFKSDETIGFYLGEIRSLNSDTQSVYRIQIDDCIIDGPGRPTNGKFMYYGMHMANDPSIKGQPNVHNIAFHTKGEVCTLRDIRAGEELFVNYGDAYMDESGVVLDSKAKRQRKV